MTKLNTMKILLLAVSMLAVLGLGGAGKSEKNLDPVRAAIEWVESKGKKDAHNKTEDALGILQIRPIMVTEVNRICGRTRFTNEDRRSVEKSREMFTIYTRHWADHYKDWSDEGIARRWNGGHDGHKEAATKGYWRKVQAEIKRKRK